MSTSTSSPSRAASRRLWLGDGGQPGVDRVPEEDAGEGRGDDRGDARARPGRTPPAPRAAAAEIPPGDHDLAGADARLDLRPERLEDVPGELRGVDADQVAPRHDQVRVDAVTELDAPAADQGSRPFVLLLDSPTNYSYGSVSRHKGRVKGRGRVESEGPKG